MINVGIIGLNPSNGWAAKSHYPALQLLKEDFVITGVANSSYKSSEAAAKHFGIPNSYKNAMELIQSPENDLVVITVKVPHHFELVKAALDAGKHVYCEHPLGNGLEETLELARIAATKETIAVVGTQMVVAPEILYLQKLLQDGYVGKVTSTTLIGSGGNWGRETVAANYYLYEKTNGATMLTIPLGHTLAGLTKVLGGIVHLDARLTSNFQTVLVKDTGEAKPKTAEDQIMIIGKLESGAAITIHYRGGISRGTNLLWEINGTEGDLQVTGPLGHGQLVPLMIQGANGDTKELQTLTPPSEFYTGLPDNPGVRNVMAVYQLLANDIKTGSRSAPSFQDALSLHELMDSIERSSR